MRNLTISLLKKINLIFSFHQITFLVFGFFLFLSFLGFAQTTFTESAAAYNLDIGGSKDGGHAWADYDLDGDYDLVINTNGRGYLLRNDGGSFTDVTAALAPDFFNNSLERTVLFVDFNNDGYPDIFRNDHSRLKIYLQFPNADPTLIRFGNGTGGTAPNQTFNGANIADGFNAEGAGAIDYDGDGDLDLFFDNHNFGIDILQNDGNGFFTQVTKKSDSPTTYNAADPTTWPLGLVQDAGVGDYGSATDFNNDGWVDIVVRKQGQVDLFTNIGGTFQDGFNIDDADNSNKGSVAFQDFDNDGDFDLFWTENGDNQIWENDGGVWMPLGVATGIPIAAVGGGQIEGLACADVDNDGDIDIYLGNGDGGFGPTSKLYLNQINNGSGAMNFVDSGLSFNNRNQGCTFIDIDEDGDLDLYINRRSKDNELWVNNLGALERANHLYIDIKEDRDVFGLINLEKRFGVGATATILDCDGTVISGIREVNGGYGHGTQEPGIIHFGLSGGSNTPIVLEIAYPRHGSGINDRVIVRQELRPIDYYNGNINIITLLPTSGNQPPIAQDDLIFVTQGSTVTFDPMADNGNGVDSDLDGNSFSILSITQPVNGTAVLNGDGTITYMPNVGFSGSDPFTYTIEDSTSCTQTNQQSIGNILMTVNGDNDNDGIADIIDLDDDNDGILDTDESCQSNVFSSGDGGGTHPFNYTNAIDGEVFFDYIDNSFQIQVDAAKIHSDILQLESVHLSSGESLIVFLSDGAEMTTPWIANVNGLPRVRVIIDQLGLVTVLGTRNTTSTSLEVMINNNGSSFNTVNFPVGATTVIITNPNGGGPDKISGTVYIQCDIDSDGVSNHLDLDSDNDGVLDAVEAGHGQAHTNGVVNGAVGTDGIPDAVQASPNSGTINYTIAESTDDSDTIPNYLDLDSDGDGIPDNVEAQTTLLYTPPNGIVDINGVDTAYAGGLTPTNTDTIDNADYLDTDSDNEGGSDTTESGLTLAGIDTDSDGLDDNIDATVGYSDPGGTIDDPLTAPVILLDADNDVNSGGDVDFRDAADDRPDHDNDGIADIDDIDDDNDGILDTDEGCGNLIINGNFEVQDFTDATIFPSGFTSAIGTFIGSTYNTNTLYGWDYTQNLDGWVGGAPLGANTFANANSRNQYIDVIGNNSASSPVGENNVLSQTIPTIVGQSYTLSFYWGEDIGHGTGATVEMDVRVRDAVTTTIIQSQNLTTTATGSVGGVIGPKNWFAYSQIFTATSIQTTIEFETTPDGTANGTTLDYVSVFKNGTCQDTDNDGVPDVFDLDSDNDGIYDAVEAGHGQAHTNGEVSGAVGDDGLPDAVQDTPNNEQINYNLANSDGIGGIDVIALDSDGDLCNDTTEAGYTDDNGDGLLGDLPVVVDNNTGLVTSGSDGYTVPSNLDGNLIFDFQEAGAVPTIDTQPLNQKICAGDNGSFTITALGDNLLYQWQVSTDDGANFSNLSDGAVYSGTNLATLVITNAIEILNKNQYRVMVSNQSYICNEVTSNVVLLTVPDVSYTLLKIDPSTCGGLNGFIILSGLKPSTIYSISHVDDGVPQGSTNYTSNASGQVVISGLSAGAFTSVVATLDGCSGSPLSIILSDPTDPVAPTSGGNITECELNPIQIVTAIANVPGATVVWYDALTGGNVVLNPDLNTAGTITYYAESYNVTTKCVSATRTPVVLTIEQCTSDLSLKKTVNNASPNQGDNIMFTLTISNAGPSSPTNIIVKDIIPTDFNYAHPNFSTTEGTVTFDAITRELVWDLGTFVLGSGNNIFLNYTLSVDIRGEFTNQAEIISSSVTDPDSTFNNGQ